MRRRAARVVVELENVLVTAERIHRWVLTHVDLLVEASVANEQLLLHKGFVARRIKIDVVGTVPLHAGRLGFRIIGILKHSTDTGTNRFDAPGSFELENTPVNDRYLGAEANVKRRIYVVAGERAIFLFGKPAALRHSHQVGIEFSLQCISVLTISVDRLIFVELFAGGVVKAVERI